jgi:hypothetical protein
MAGTVSSQAGIPADKRPEKRKIEKFKINARPEPSVDRWPSSAKATFPNERGGLL